MKIAFKLLIVFVVFVPVGILTAAIWVLGGWTQQPYMRPNPLNSLFKWLDK